MNGTHSLELHPPPFPCPILKLPLPSSGSIAIQLPTDLLLLLLQARLAQIWIRGEKKATTHDHNGRKQEKEERYFFLDINMEQRRGFFVPSSQLQDNNQTFSFLFSFRRFRRKSRADWKVVWRRRERVGSISSS